MRRIRMERRKEKNVRKKKKCKMDKRGCRVRARRWHG